MPELQRPSPATTLEEANAQVELLWEVVVELKSKIEDLDEQLRQKRGKHSGNSSNPPSSDTPAQRKKRRKKPRSARKKGAQPGHPLNQRSILPEESVDKIERYLPPAECSCGAPVERLDKPHCRHQVFDIPRVRYTVTEHQIYGGRCACCNKLHVADTPQSVPAGQMGPNLIATIAHLSGQCHLSIRLIQRFLHEHWQLDFSTGAISQSQAKANTAMGEPYRQIGKHVRAQSVAHADETRHFRGNSCYWLWTLVTLNACFLMVHYSRGMKAADELLGSFTGVLVTDDYSGYNRVPDGRHQLCWPHLIRLLTDIAERVGNGGRIGKRLLLVALTVIRTRHRFRDELIDEPRYLRRMNRLRKSFHSLIESGASLHTDGRTRNQCRHLLKREHLWWTFLSDHRVPLDNNTAEQALRSYVIWRKLSFASQSHQGDQFRPMILSIVETARRVGVSSYEFLRTICTESMETGRVSSRLPLDAPRLTAS